MKTFGAKQIASRIGTDPKTLRKFLRSAASPYESVGQGGRYEFPVADLKEIDAAFHKWHDRPTPPRVITAAVHIGSDHKTDMEVIDDELDEPTEEDLAAIAAEELE